MEADAKERIPSRAYQIWENEGRPEGEHQRHWIMPSMKSSVTMTTPP